MIDMTAERARAVIESRVDMIPECGCWLWNRALADTGYGQFRTTNHLHYAHRLSYEAFVGDIPKGLWVLHRCDVRCCVNPQHLFLGTRQDNITDARLKGRLKYKKGRKPRPRGLIYHIKRIYIRKYAYLDGEIKELKSAGFTIGTIAKKLKVNRSTVVLSLRVSGE